MGIRVKARGTAKFSSEIAISLKFTAEHTENAKAPESLNNELEQSLNSACSALSAVINHWIFR